MQMPDLRVPDLSRRQIIALVVVVAGLVAIGLALFGGSGSGGPKNGTQGNQAIDPVSPLDPRNEDAGGPDSKNNPLSDLTDPFATSFGGNFRHKITVRVSSATILRYAVRFRDGHEEDRVVSGGTTISRTIKGGFPLVQVGVRNAHDSSRASCSVSIDGVKVSSNTTHKRLGIVICSG